MPKNLSSKQYVIHLIFFVILVGAASVANVIFKVAATGFQFTWNPIEFVQLNWMLLVGYGLYVLPTLITVYLYKFYKVGFVQAIASGIYVVTPTIAYFTNVEKFNELKLLGVAIIFSAVLFLVIPGKKDATN